jgi:hypothetical protein
MKTIKITYWISTVAFAAIFTTTSTLYFMHNPRMVDKFNSLGLPLYLLELLGTAKYIGVLGLLLPKFPRLKEWAYAGFFIDLTAACWCHLVVQGIHGALPLTVPITILLISYLSFHRLQKVKAAN